MLVYINLQTSTKTYFLQNLSNALNSSLKLTESLILIGDFDIGLDNIGFHNFAGCFDLQSLIKEWTCFKGEPSCFDLTLTNKISYLKHNKTFVNEYQIFIIIWLQMLQELTASKLSKNGVFLVHVFLYLDWIRTRKTLFLDTFDVVTNFV